MGELWQMYEAYRSRHAPFPPPSRRWVAAQLEMSPTALGNWSKDLSGLPTRRNLLRFADLTGVPYERVLNAALVDARLLPESAARQAAADEGGLDKIVDDSIERHGLTKREKSGDAGPHSDADLA